MSTSSNDSMVPCSHCLEMIGAAVTPCPHCGHEFSHEELMARQLPMDKDLTHRHVTYLSTPTRLTMVIVPIAFLVGAYLLLRWLFG